MNDIFQEFYHQSLCHQSHLALTTASLGLKGFSFKNNSSSVQVNFIKSLKASLCIESLGSDSDFWLIGSTSNKEYNSR
ncbi:hypothetical protein O181_000178 [Austropuccinia psidii MF-1]|uniref:Uncharacterized protein n=1 Tax=Austropuccinia psidii MF-1 TaxID=1389203 RepID=A0A9Q3GAN2_9BASI|nr:hypothetical protein [Austropuccinia psidii MF-1]